MLSLKRSMGVVPFIIEIGPSCYLGQVAFQTRCFPAPRPTMQGDFPTVVGTDQSAHLPPLDLLVGKLLRAFCHAQDRSSRRPLEGLRSVNSGFARVVKSTVRVREVSTVPKRDSTDCVTDRNGQRQRMGYRSRPGLTACDARNAIRALNS
jgi:hypothetical protein